MIFFCKKIMVGRGMQGMTLLEIMLAMLVLTMIVGMVSLSLSGSIDVVDATRKQGELYYRAQVALQRISEDLTSTLLIEGVEFVGEDRDVNGQPADVLSFTSMAHIVFDPANDNPGIAFISYTVRPDKENDGELVLLRADDLLAATDAAVLAERENAGFLLSDRLRSVDFVFIDDAGDEHDSWSTVLEPGEDPDRRKLPVAVRCTLQYWLDRDEESSIEFSTSVLLPVGLINAQDS